MEIVILVISIIVSIVAVVYVALEAFGVWDTLKNARINTRFQKLNERIKKRKLSPRQATKVMIDVSNATVDDVEFWLKKLMLYYLKKPQKVWELQCSFKALFCIIGRCSKEQTISNETKNTLLEKAEEYVQIAKDSFENYEDIRCNKCFSKKEN